MRMVNQHNSIIAGQLTSINIDDTYIICFITVNKCVILIEFHLLLSFRG
jgi:hypothetical protein